MTDTNTQAAELISDAELDDLLGLPPSDEKPQTAAEPAEKEPPMSPEESELAAVVDEVAADEAPEPEPEPEPEQAEAEVTGFAGEGDDVDALIEDVLATTPAKQQDPEAEALEVAQVAQREEILSAGKAKTQEHLKQLAREERVEESAGEFGGASDDLETAAPKPARGMRLSPSQLQEDLKISRADVDVSMRDQAGLYGHYAMISMQAGLSADRKKSELEILEAQVDEELRNKAADEGVKVTEAALSKKILLDSRVQSKRYELNKAKAEASLAKEALEALKMRRDMLVQIGKDRREEMLGDMRVQAHDSRMSGLKDAAMKQLGGQG